MMCCWLLILDISTLVFKARPDVMGSIAAVQSLWRILRKNAHVTPHAPADDDEALEGDFGGDQMRLLQPSTLSEAAEAELLVRRR